MEESSYSDFQSKFQGACMMLTDGDFVETEPVHVFPEIDGWSIEDFDFSVAPSLLLDEGERERRQVQYAIRRGEEMASATPPPSVDGLVTSKGMWPYMPPRRLHRKYAIRALVVLVLAGLVVCIAVMLTSPCTGLRCNASRSVDATLTSEDKPGKDDTNEVPSDSEVSTPNPSQPIFGSDSEISTPSPSQPTSGFLRASTPSPTVLEVTTPFPSEVETLEPTTMPTTSTISIGEQSGRSPTTQDPGSNEPTQIPSRPLSGPPSTKSPVTSTQMPTDMQTHEQPTVPPTRMGTTWRPTKASPATQDPRTSLPTQIPTKLPTDAPTTQATAVPTQLPPVKVTQSPTRTPTKQPTDPPTATPTVRATTSPPTQEPTVAPTSSPTNQPTSQPPVVEPTGPAAPAAVPFTLTTELYDAVDAYLADNSDSSAVARKYGHPIGSWDVSQITNFGSLFSALRNPAAATFNEPLSGWDTRSAVSFNEMFRSAISFNQDLPWQVSKVTTTRFMFLNCNAFDGDLSGWDTRSLENMLGMFLSAPSFRGTGLKTWNVQSVTTMKATFSAASSFQGDISGWNVARVTDFSATFRHAASFNADLSGWSVSNAVNMNAMFYGAASFTSKLTSWDVSRVQDLTRMFTGALRFNHNLCSWDLPLTAKTDMMFLATSCPRTSDPDLGVGLTYFCQSCRGAIILPSANQRGPDRDTPVYGRRNFTSTSHLYHAVDSYLSDLHAGQLSRRHRRFPIRYWDVSRITDFSELFSAQRNPLAVLFNEDLRQWDVSKAVTMESMFEEAFSFSGDLSSWQVDSLKDISHMFQYAISFHSDLQWNVQAVRQAGWAFRGAISFDSKDVAGWNLASCESFNKMFAGATSFQQNLCSWRQPVRTDATVTGMFAGTACPVPAGPGPESFCHVCVS